jgi:hypothetical protein
MGTREEDDMQNQKTDPKVIAVQRAGKENGDKYLKLVEYLRQLQETQFTGYIKVNFSQGSVGRIEKFEEILKK